MKRWIMILCMTLSLLLPCVTAEAVTVYKNAYALYSVGWGGGYPYPEGVTGVWSETGSLDKLVIGIAADADVEQLKADILAQIEDKDSVSFLVQDYSYELLHEIYGSLGGEREKYGAEDVYTWGIHENENGVKIGADIENPSPELEAFMAECKEKYGDAVQFYECEGVSPTEAVVPIEAVPQEGDVTDTPQLDIGGEPDTDAVTIEETDEDVPAAEEEQMLDAGDGLDLPAGISPGLGTVGMESEEPHHRPLVPVLGAGILLLGGCTALLLHRRRTGKIMQNSAGGTQTAIAAHPDIPALMKQTAARPTDDLREKVIALTSTDQSKQ